MAQETGAGQNANQEINIDELEVEILIVAKNPSNLKQTCAFLTRRGWPTVAHGNLSKAVEEIAEKRPDIVMISFNHPSPAVQKLPEIIAQTFNLMCVGFVEGTDTASTSKLNNMKLRHKIFGTPSGPNFHRGIRRILAEKFNIKLDEKPEKAERENNVTVRGGKGDGAADKSAQNSAHGLGADKRRGPVVISGKSGAGVEGAGAGNLAYMPDAKDGSHVADDDNGGGFAHGQQSGDGDQVMGAQRGSGSGKSLKAHEGSGSGNALSGVQSGSAENASSSGQLGRGGGLNGLAGQGGAAGSAESEDDYGHDNAQTEDDDIGSVNQMGKDFKKKGDMALGKRKKLKALTATDAHDAGGNMMLGEDLDPGNPQPPPPVSDINKKDLAEMLKKSLFDGGVEEHSPQSLMEKAVEKAIGDVCQRNPDIRPIPLKTVTKVGVFPLDSAAVPGYLVIALEDAPAEDQKRFLKNCESALRGAFETMGVAGKLENGFWMDVPQTPFDQWVQNAGVFSFKQTHLGCEVGVSYFQTERPIVKAQPSDIKDMYTVALDDISTDEPVTFKAYLHLKANDKFYLYLRNGRQLQPEQKQRLQANEIGVVFMKTVDLENFRVFLAAAYLKETIRSSTIEAA